MCCECTLKKDKKKKKKTKNKKQKNQKMVLLNPCCPQPHIWGSYQDAE